MAPPEDSVDRHLARWRGKAPYDETVEAVVTRLQMLTKHVANSKRRMHDEVGLADFEFQTLHRLAARDGHRATPSELAADLLLSPAGMTGRLDALEQAGLVRRIRGTADRRRVDVELTEQGHAKWLAGMRFQDVAERQIVGALDERERGRVNALLKKMLLRAEELAAADAGSGGLAGPVGPADTGSGSTGSNGTGPAAGARPGGDAP
ncbi:MarR family winged helix-turn-helix transcriptional regulator [Catenulispora pinisilvae]|uniref:MarR family winged helix-turn-helix transcriptional regulator n=1 Tax=Catenulispora pinisilvae TaxID=2705253 RepID=UPI001891161A|nr:MarR family winged helix-turn-helix transcriptional regulator [Catenulispora pinisilvae]